MTLSCQILHYIQKDTSVIWWWLYFHTEENLKALILQNIQPLKILLQHTTSSYFSFLRKTLMRSFSLDGTEEGRCGNKKAPLTVRAELNLSAVVNEGTPALVTTGASAL